MLTPIVTTKLYIPPPRPDVIPRPRLLKRLNNGLNQKLILVAAPAGFGKTTAVCEWLNTLTVPITWLALDENDNDPHRFFNYFLAALQKITPALGQTVQELLHQPQLPAPETLAAFIINEVAANVSEFVMVLDDFHVIKTPFITQALTFLLNNLPPHLHLVITSRSEPSLPLARFRARGQMIEILVDDLRFTIAETLVLLQQEQLTLTPADQTTLTNRLEGWVTGLQLAILSMQGRSKPQIHQFVNSFSGSHRYILDYLAGEVLDQQPETLQNFLRQTAILPRLTGPLCDALTGQTNGRSTLQELERRNLFLAPLDDERRWYRYHNLFAGFLRDQLQQTDPAAVSELHRRAGVWFEENGFTTEAVEHGLAAADFERVAYLLEQHADHLLWEGGSIRVLLKWLKALPEALIKARPRLAVTKAAMLSENFTDPDHRATIELLLQAAETALQAETAATVNKTDKQRSMWAEINMIRASLARYGGDVPQAISLVKRALTHVPEDNAFLREGATQMLAIAQSSLGQMGEARRTFDRGLTINQAAGDRYGLTLATAYLIEILAVQGQLHQAKQVFGQVLPAIGGRHGPDVGMVYLNIANVFREWNQLGTAEHYLRQGLELCRPFNSFAAMVVAGQITLARVLQALGKEEDSLEMLRLAGQPPERDIAYYPAARPAAYQARLWLAQGNHTKAAHWAHNSSLRPEDAPGEYRYEIDYLTLARILITQNRLDEAATVLAALYPSAQSAERTSRVIEILLLQAWLVQAQGNIKQAMARLQNALVLAESEGFVRMFVDEGEPVRNLLQHAASAGIAAKYVATLLAAEDHTDSSPQDEPATIAGVAANTPAAPSDSATAALVEPLTDRELEVLRLVAQGLTNREVATKLIVATSTVKKHLENIYGKLNVNNRTQAIATARTLKLL